MSFALYTYKDVDGDRISVFVADIPGEGRGVSIHSDRNGCSIPADEITNFIVGVIAAAGLEPDDITTLARAVLAAAGDTGHVVLSRDELTAMRRADARSMRERALQADATYYGKRLTEEIRALPLLPGGDDPCSRTTPHMAHRNWQSDDVGVCPGVHTVKEES